MIDRTAALVAEAKDGDRNALEALLIQCLPGVRAYVRLRTGPLVRAKESSSDLVQSVCREVLENISRFHYTSECAFRKWLYELSLHKILDRNRYYRAQKRAGLREVRIDPATADHARLLDCYRSFCSPSGDAMVQEEIGRIEGLFDRLSDKDKEIIVLARIYGLSHAQIAETTGRTKAAVRNSLHRALVRFSALLVASQRNC